jgi:hypothetical protein
MIQQTIAPPGCRECGHIILVTITHGGRAERYDRCGHPTGPHPMHDPCAWKVEKREGAKE